MLENDVRPGLLPWDKGKTWRVMAEKKINERSKIAMFGHKRWSREGGVEIVVKELCTRMAQKGCEVTCYNRSGHHVSGAEYDSVDETEYKGITQKYVPTIEKKGLAAVSSSFFAALCSAFGKYDVVHIHAEGPAFFSCLPKMLGKRVVVTIHGIDWQREKWQSGFGSKFIRQGKYKFIPNGIALEKFSYNVSLRKEMRKKLGVEDKFVIGHAGRFNIQKNHEYLIEMFSALHVIECVEIPRETM